MRKSFVFKPSLSSLNKVILQEAANSLEKDLQSLSIKFKNVHNSYPIDIHDLISLCNAYGKKEVCLIIEVSVNTFEGMIKWNNKDRKRI